MEQSKSLRFLGHFQLVPTCCEVLSTIRISGKIDRTSRGIRVWTRSRRPCAQQIKSSAPATQTTQNYRFHDFSLLLNHIGVSLVCTPFYTITRLRAQVGLRLLPPALPSPRGFSSVLKWELTEPQARNKYLISYPALQCNWLRVREPQKARNGRRAKAKSCGRLRTFLASQLPGPEANRALRPSLVSHVDLISRAPQRT